MNIETISHDGRPLLIDLNARISGSTMSLRSVGPQLDADYLTARGVVVPGRGTSARVGDRFMVFPDEVELLVAQGRWAPAIGTFLRRA